MSVIVIAPGGIANENAHALDEPEASATDHA
jgi:hypothetical protein